MHPLVGLARIATGASAIIRMTLPGIIISAVAWSVWKYAIKPEIGKYGANSDDNLPTKKTN